ncbi:hypothetical protein PV328_005810 [Microctonus aethiopoides]|uniref:Uncharacterized protein n=1 Tax=Microctonus aethiopoides TaxID=144406 RepID=A0AA39FMR6_9HYME|nr:hypothetical protein PV328_005810 [Microctonus aethiopoides]
MGLVCKKWQNIHNIMLRSIHKMRVDLTDDVRCRRFVRHHQNVLEILTNNLADIEKPLEKLASNLNKIDIEDKTQHGISSDVYKLLSNCTELKYIRLCCRRSQSVKEFLKFLPTDNLEHLLIQLPRTYEDDQPHLNHLMKTALAKTSKLKTLELCDVPISELSSIGRPGTLKELYIKVDRLPLLNFNMKNLQNLETLIIICYLVDNSTITELMRNCRKLHSFAIRTKDILPETTLNEMMSLPNLRRLHLLSENNSYQSWHKFSNLEDIAIIYQEPVSVTRDQIISFLQRSKNLKTYSIHCNKECTALNEFFCEVASDIGHECKRHYITPWDRRYIRLYPNTILVQYKNIFC